MANDTKDAGVGEAPDKSRSKRDLISAVPFWAVAVTGVFLILLGFFIEDRLDDFGAIYSKLTNTEEYATAAPEVPAGNDVADGTPQTDHQNDQGQRSGPVSTDLAVEEADQSYSGHKLSFGLVVVLLLKELGVAAIVAGIIGGIFESQVREREARHSRQLRLEVAEDATFALFGLSHDHKFVKAAIATNLKADIVRVDLTQHYKLRELTDEEARTVDPACPEEAQKRFVMLDMEQIYGFRNVASHDIDHSIPIGVPRRSGNGIAELTEANFVSLDGNKLTDGEIKNGIDEDSSTRDYLQYRWTRRIKSGETCSVIANVVTIKERSDNEVWGSFFPTMGDVTLSLQALPGMRYDVRKLSNGMLEPADGVPIPNKKTWKLTGPLLRHNSVVFWWRTAADDGAAICPPEDNLTDAAETAQETGNDVKH